MLVYLRILLIYKTNHNTCNTNIPLVSKDNCPHVQPAQNKLNKGFQKTWRQAVQMNQSNYRKDASGIGMVLTISACFICLSKWYTTRNPREVPDLTTRQLQKSYCYNKFLICFFFFFCRNFRIIRGRLVWDKDSNRNQREKYLESKTDWWIPTKRSHIKGRHQLSAHKKPTDKRRICKKEKKRKPCRRMKELLTATDLLQIPQDAKNRDNTLEEKTRNIRHIGFKGKTNTYTTQ